MTTKQRLSLYVAWVVAILAMAGSLYFSEVLHLPPCSLCWYQRIFMYPLVFIIGVGLLQNDKNVLRYILPLSSIGLLIAIYHVLLYYGIIPEALAPCSIGASCTVKQIEWFGFVTIPVLSLLSFIVINLCVGLSLMDAKKRS
jgi:disulfide bond formation protein DsbB